MRQHSNQVKSGSGHSLVWVFLCVFALSSCNKDSLEEIIYPDRHYFWWTLEFEVNGKKVANKKVWESETRPYNQILYPPEYSQFIVSGNITTFSGYRVYKDDGIDYSKLSFNMMQAGLYVHIVGPGDGKFKEKDVYSSPDDILLYHPSLSDFSSHFFMGSLDEGDIIPSFDGFEVKLLSSSSRFGHSIKWRVGKVLDYYFDFEEVITAVPEGYDQRPAVGDTVRITNGHLTHLWSVAYDEIFK